MADSIGPIGGAGEHRKLLDEIEQLRTSLESVLDENADLLDERNQLRQQVATQARLAAEARTLRRTPPPPEPHDAAREELAAREDRGQADEELRVAFEELQVLTEELEVSNAGLHEANRTLDGRVEERTRALERTSAALRGSEASFRAVANLVPDLLWSGGRDGKAQWYNDRWYAYSGQTEAEARDDGWIHAVHPAAHAIVRSAWHGALISGQPFAHEVRLRKADGSHRWFLARAEQARDETGHPGQWFGALTDIDDQRTTLEALGRSELRFRTLVEGMPQLVWRAVDGGEWTWSSPQWTEFTGIGGVQSRGKGWRVALHPDDRTALEAAWTRAYETGVFEMEMRLFGVRENRYRSFRGRAMPARTADNRIVEWLGTCTDVDDLLALQRQQVVLIAELQHRTRNLMAVVQGILGRTLRDSTTLDGFGAAMTDRMAALARVQGLLSGRGAGRHVAFDALLREELATLGRAAQVETGGPLGIPLSSASVQTLALALHELATNAVKYGALSTTTGRLAVTWDVAAGLEGEGPNERWLRIEWRESGVPNMPEPGAAPHGGGYGRELIERALPYQLGARVSYAFASDGVRCSIAVPVAEE